MYRHLEQGEHCLPLKTVKITFLMLALQERSVYDEACVCVCVYVCVLLVVYSRPMMNRGQLPTKQLHGMHLVYPNECHVTTVCVCVCVCVCVRALGEGLSHY